MAGLAVHAAPRVLVGHAAFLEENLRGLALNTLISDRIRQAAARGAVVKQSDGTPLLDVDGRFIGGPLGYAELKRAAQQAKRESAFVVMGLGLGHVPRALRDVSDQPIVVYEPDAGVLKTVLEHGPADLGQFSLATNAHELAAAWAHLPGQFNAAVVVNTPGYAELFPAESARLHQMVSELLERVQVTRNTYRRRSRDWIADVLANVGALSTTVPFLKLKGKYRGVPAFIVGAGPSLDKNIDFIADATKKGIVFSVNSSSRPLAEHGIQPQVLACIESLDSSDLLEKLPFIDDVVRAFSLTAAPNILRTGKGPLLPIYESLPQLNKPLEALTGVTGLPVCGSVSTVAFSLAEHLGCSPIVLIGQDLAYTTGRTHAGGTWWETSRANVSEETGQVQLEWSESLKKIGHRHEQEPLVQIRAWGGEGTVSSGVSFSGIRAWFEAAADILHAIRPEVILVNATEGGARIEGFDERTLASVLSTLPELNITARSIAERAREEAEPLGTDAVVAWLENQKSLTSSARRRARRVEKLARHAVHAIRGNDPLSVTRAFDALSHAERALGEAVREAPLLDAWCHAEVDEVMSAEEAGADSGQRESAVRATQRGVRLATAIERAARELENEFQKIILRLTD